MAHRNVSRSECGRPLCVNCRYAWRPDVPRECGCTKLAGPDQDESQVRDAREVSPRERTDVVHCLGVETRETLDGRASSIGPIGGRAELHNRASRSPSRSRRDDRPVVGEVPEPSAVNVHKRSCGVAALADIPTAGAEGVLVRSRLAPRSTPRLFEGVVESGGLGVVLWGRWWFVARRGGIRVAGRRVGVART